MSKVIRNIISIPLLLKQVYEIRLMGNGFSIFFSNKFYGNDYNDNNLLILALKENTFDIESNMKRKRRCKYHISLTLPLGHISETRINKLYKGEYFDPYDFQSLKTCESCLMGKMIKTPFSEHGERVKELLILVHSDICRPMTTQAR